MDHLPVLGLDADDTLWENEAHFRQTEDRFLDLVAPWADHETAAAALLAAEKANLSVTGYGIKGFVLSMVETAISLSDGACDAGRIGTILDWGRWMLQAPVDPLPGVAETLEVLAADHRLLVITKGDLGEQLRKVAASGLDGHFWQVEVVAHKTAEAYRDVLDGHGITPADFVMVGNSVPSDVLPVLALGGRAVHVPHHTTWALETVHADDVDGHDFPVLDSLAELPALLTDWRG